MLDFPLPPGCRHLPQDSWLLQTFLTVIAFVIVFVIVFVFVFVIVLVAVFVFKAQLFTSLCQPGCQVPAPMLATLCQRVELFKQKISSKFH